MNPDEKAIRDLVATWMSASKSGDLATVLSLMSDDVTFMVPGHEPFGKAEFAASSKGMQGVQIDGTSDIVELKILGDWAWIRNHLRMTVTPSDGLPMTRSGYTLTILQKNADGKWQLVRDANLLAPEKKSQ